ncbi:MAG: hypothetical protein JW798_09205, partial [Prolixibacteraceae bacterium]|nr:hypothetical protein [Prolixibacteraceae bacterium]
SNHPGLLIFDPFRVKLSSPHYAQNFGWELAMTQVLCVFNQGGSGIPASPESHYLPFHTPQSFNVIAVS